MGRATDQHLRAYIPRATALALWLGYPIATAPGSVPCEFGLHRDALLPHKATWLWGCGFPGAATVDSVRRVLEEMAADGVAWGRALREEVLRLGPHAGGLRRIRLDLAGVQVGPRAGVGARASHGSAPGHLPPLSPSPCVKRVRAWPAGACGLLGAQAAAAAGDGARGAAALAAPGDGGGRESGFAVPQQSWPLWGEWIRVVRTHQLS